MIVEDEVETMFQDSLASRYDAALERRLEELIARDRTHGLNSEERREFWTLSQALARK
jgi:DNA primase